MAVFTFLEEYDFSGKTVIPFCAHGTSGVARSIRDIRQAIPEAEIEQELGVSCSDMAKAQELVRAWLEEKGVRRNEGTDKYSLRKNLLFIENVV